MIAAAASPLGKWVQDAFYGVRNRLRICVGIEVPFETRAFVRMNEIPGQALGFAIRSPATGFPGVIVLDGYKLDLHEDQEPTGDLADAVRGLIVHEALHLVQTEARHHGKEFEALCTRAARAFHYLPPVSRQEARNCAGHPRAWPQGCGISVQPKRGPQPPHRPRPADFESAAQSLSIELSRHLPCTVARIPMLLCTAIAIADTFSQPEESSQ